MDTATINFYENGTGRDDEDDDDEERSMDRTRRCSAGSLREHVRRSAVGFSGQSFRFAKVLVGESQNWIGLKRSGKSCRLRWVNYLQPGLKRGKITPQEQRLILQLHSKWGNRWSKIAQKLPGRTDNEIKNYWRTHMRKKANEDRANKCASSSSPSSSSSLSNNSSSSSGETSSPPAVESRPIPATNERNFYDTGGIIFEDEIKTPPPQQQQEEETEKKMDHHHQQQQLVCSSSMDDIWKDMESWAEQQKGGCTMWNYWSEWVWTTTCSSSNNNRMCPPPPPPPASTDRLCFFDNQDYICTI